MIALQDDYAKRMYTHGLSRGEQGSRRKHVPQKQVYRAQATLEHTIDVIADITKAAVESTPIPDISISQVMTTGKRAAWADEVRTTIAEAVDAATAQAREATVLSGTNTAIAAATQSELSRVIREHMQLRQIAEQSSQKASEYAAQLRDIPLSGVLAGMGYVVRQEGSSQICHTAQGKIGIKGIKWFNYHQQHGGGGAIDLVMHLEQCDYPTALQYLAQAHGRGTIGAIAIDAVRVGSQVVNDTPRASFQELITRYAQRDDTAWPRAREYLLGRGIPASQSDALHRDGLMWATHRGGVAFGHRSLVEGEVSGATIRGISTQFKQTIGDRKSAFFYFGAPVQEATKLYITESPIDALSLAEIIPSKGATYLSTAGVPPKDLWDHIPRKPEWILAFDADEAGTRFRSQLLQAAKRLGRRCQAIIPSKGKDWNEELVLLRANSRPAPHYGQPLSLNSTTIEQSIKYTSCEPPIRTYT